MSWKLHEMDKIRVSIDDPSLVKLNWFYEHLL